MEKNLVEFITNHSWVIVLVLLWTLPWKAAALWRSARRAQLGWFLTMLVLNTLGILEIIYLAFFSNEEVKQENETISKAESKFVVNQDATRKVSARKIIM